jgi:GT2 family glycosyltransferase
MMSFGTVICTYNRPTILEKALAHWEKSTYLPDQFLVVDASHNAHKYRKDILDKFPKLFQQAGSDYIISTQPGLTRQRNLGLKLLSTDISCFADDDTFVTPTYVDRIRQIFQSDNQQIIGGINGVAKGQFDTWSHRYFRLSKNYIRHHFGNHLGQRIHIPHHGTQRHKPIPTHLKDYPLIHIDRLWGANMNYRTELIQALGFDDNFIRYGLYEDVEVSARLGKSHKLVCCLDAEVQHDDTLGQTTRPNDARYFLASWINSAYIIEKLFPCGESRNAHHRFLNLTRYIAHSIPQSLRARKLKAFGTPQLWTLVDSFLQELQDCQSPNELADKFVEIQHMITDFSE